MNWKKILSLAMLGAYIFSANVQVNAATFNENKVAVEKNDKKNPPEPPKDENGKPLPPPDKKFDKNNDKKPPEPPKDKDGKPLPPPENDRKDINNNK